MSEKVKEIKKQDYKGKVSYSLSTESGKNGLVTAANLEKYHGKVEQIKVGDEVPVVFEDVTKAGGSGKWTSATFPSWEEGKGESTGSGAGKSSWSNKDVYGTIINNALIAAVNVFTSSPAGTKTVEELFEAYVNMAVTKYNAVKQ
jgi:hypothetical protein